MCGMKNITLELYTETSRQATLSEKHSVWLKEESQLRYTIHLNMRCIHFTLLLLIILSTLFRCFLCISYLHALVNCLLLYRIKVCSLLCSIL